MMSNCLNLDVSRCLVSSTYSLLVFIFIALDATVDDMWENIFVQCVYKGHDLK